MRGILGCILFENLGGSSRRDRERMGLIRLLMTRRETCSTLSKIMILNTKLILSGTKTFLYSVYNEHIVTIAQIYQSWQARAARGLFVCVTDAMEALSRLYIDCRPVTLSLARPARTAGNWYL
jgi:hypothetical protein